MTMKKLLQLFESEQVAEKAVSQQQQKFMGMVHAMQKGETVKGASPELEKVAKTMSKKDAKDFASTKHKGLPKKVDESVMLEAGNNLEHIITRFKHETKNFLNGNELDDDLYNALYDFYLDNGEMPYGVAKARQGDPYQWVQSQFEDALRMMGHERQFNETVIPVVDSQLSELARLAGLSESRVDECDDMGMNQESSMNISTNMNSNGTKSVTISAQGDDADTLLQMLKLAGMNRMGNDNDQSYIVAHEDEEVEEDYANEPDEEYHSVDSIIHQGTDLNREKRQYADKPKLGDNPMAENVSMDEGLADLLDSILIKNEDKKFEKDPVTGRVKMTFPPGKKPDQSTLPLQKEPFHGPRNLKVDGEKTGTENFKTSVKSSDPGEVDEGSITKGGPNDLTGTWSADAPGKGQPDVPPPVPMDPVYPNAKDINKPKVLPTPKGPMSSALPRPGIKK